MDPSALTCYQSPYPKMRLGKDNDGGYIVVDVPDVKYELLIAGGIFDDISFEEDFLKKYDIKCIALDGSIENLPSENAKIEFVKKHIGDNNTEYVTDLHDVINSHDNIFVKMDIEGGEIPWIKSLSHEQVNKFDQIVIEFHWPYSQSEVDVFDKINKNHVLVHFHGNNGAGTVIHKDVTMPCVFECTYLHKKFFADHKLLNTELIPGPLDMRNSFNDGEIHIDYPPFVHPFPTEQPLYEPVALPDPVDLVEESLD